MNEEFRKEISHAELLYEKGDYEQALKLVESLVGQNGLSEENRIICTLLESKLRVQLGDPQKAYSLIEDILQKAHKFENHLQIADILIVKAQICWRIGELDQGFIVVEEGELLLSDYGQENPDEKESEVNPRLANLLNHGGIILWYKGDLDRAFEYHQRSLKIRKELGDKQSIARSLNNLGLVFYSKSDFDKALEYYKESLIIW